MPTEAKAPWKQAPLNEWSIVGMNHYTRKGKDKSFSNGLSLYVAMTKGDKCIRAEGADDDRVWFELRVQTILVELPKVFNLDFRPATSDDEFIRTVFSTKEGGLIWCALRCKRLAGPDFNRCVSDMMGRLRTQPNQPWAVATNIARELPRQIFGTNEMYLIPEWGEALKRIVSPDDPFDHYQFRTK